MLYRTGEKVVQALIFGKADLCKMEEMSYGNGCEN